MSTIQAQSVSELSVSKLKDSRNFLMGLVETLSESQMTTRAGGVGNHAIWIIGHIAFADDLFVSAFRNQASILPLNYSEMFGQGSTPSDRIDSYPSFQSMLNYIADTRKRTIEWAQTLVGEAAWQESPESIRTLAGNAINAAFTLSQHEFLHAGQLTVIRSSLEMKPVFG